MASSNGTPQSSPCKGPCLACKVLMLDDSIHTFQISTKSTGVVLYDAVINKLQLLEADYFDLQYNDSESIPCWLDHEKPILKQVTRSQLFFKFLLKFYTPDPGLLEEEHTRYLLALQLKRDLLSGDLYCQEHTAVLLASYIVQAEVGNYCEEYVNQAYISSLHLLPNQSPEIEQQIMEHHKEHINQTPAEADFNLLDTARKVELYGIQLHPAQDHDGANLHLAVSHSGILVFQNYTKINSFSWAKIRKLCFKRKKFQIKLHPEGMECFKDTVEFYFQSRNWSKTFWKKCIEHHTFFRCHTVKHIPRTKAKVISHGSSFRYCGRTQKELVDYAREKSVKPMPFERTTSMRTMSALHSHAGSPKTGTLNSRDLNFGGILTSTSSGSRTLDRTSQDNAANVYRAANMQDQKITPTIPESTFRSYQLQSPSSGFPIQNTGALPGVAEPNHRVQKSSSPGVSLKEDGFHSSQTRLDPSQFMLPRDGRSSAPSLAEMPLVNSNVNSPETDHHLLRTAEIEDIPERVHEQRNDQSLSYIKPQTLHHSVSETPIRNNGIEIVTDVDDLPPPPPPPVFESSRPPHEKIPMIRESFDHPLPTTSKSTVSAASMTLTSNASMRSCHTDESEDDRKKKKVPTDRIFYLAKELLMTERTYKKDLEVITVWFREAMSREDVMPDYLTQLFFSSVLPIYQFESEFLACLEQRLAAWEGKTGAQQLNRDQKRVGDILLSITTALQLYQVHFDRHQDILMELDVALKQHAEFERAINDFESHKVCYLPLNAFVLKPAQRILYYKQILEKIISSMTSDNHPDMADCCECLDKVAEVAESLNERLLTVKKVKKLKEKLFELGRECNLIENILSLPDACVVMPSMSIGLHRSQVHTIFLDCKENLQKLIELQRGLLGIDNLVQPNRLFLREGCLQKLSRRGCQQRMFFLFSDQLVYTSRMATPSLQFKVHGQLSLKGMSVTDEDVKISSVSNGFAIYCRNRYLVVAASSQEEKEKWMTDLRRAIQNSSLERDDDVKILYPSLKSNSSSEALDDSRDDCRSPPSPDHQSLMQHRANNTMHVCWHRSTSVGINDHCVALENQLSGYLLRKFKNSNGWQKLWVVFTNFCLFFYKNYQDDFPLASLPLLSYTISTPVESDGIQKEFVFKLQFKNHVYFFRAESQVTFERWMEVIGHVTLAVKSTPESNSFSSNSCLQPPSEY